MKRSRLKPGKHLQRKTEMSRGKSFAASAGALATKAKKKASRPKPAAPKSVIDLIKDRSVACEIGLICLGRAEGVQSAHRRGKGSGGVGKKNTTSNTASGLLRACADCHDLVDRRDIPGAQRLGLKLKHTPTHPYEMPVAHWELGWVLLDDEGGWSPAPEAAIHETGPLPVVLVSEDFSIEDDNRVEEAVRRFGHGDCVSYDLTFGQPVECSCGSSLFVVAVRAEGPALLSGEALRDDLVRYGSPSDMDEPDPLEEYERAILAEDGHRYAGWGEG